MLKTWDLGKCIISHNLLQQERRAEQAPHQIILVMGNNQLPVNKEIQCDPRDPNLIGYLT